LFASVVAALGSLGGAHVLDLYAGSGAVGLEALSRGAADAMLIESDPGAVQVIRQNVQAVGLPGATVIKDKVGRALRRGPGAAPRRDFVFADPPYAITDEEIGSMLMTLEDAGWLAAGALVVVERDARSGEPPWPPGYAHDRSRRYGETVLWYGRACGTAPAAATTTGA
jgi:16S rRNA (guanine966-N2)-methyltransferase